MQYSALLYPVRCLLAIAGLLIVVQPVAADLTPKEELGKSIFFDDNLSINGNQSCASCHGQEAGWTGPLSDINADGAVYEGSIAGRFGNRKPPSSAYATPSPVLHFVVEKPKNKNKRTELFIGGNFWDGRATGEKLGNPAADQAQGPFVNPLEQALPDSACVVYRVCTDYFGLFQTVWGPDTCDITTWPADVPTVCAEGDPVSLSDLDRAMSETVYDQIALSVAAYEASEEVNAYTSKYDYFLAGLVRLTKQEKKGLNMFKSKGKCANCHILGSGPNGEPPLFTDFTFDNLGVPRNPDNPFYGQTEFNPLGDAWIDMGLGGFLDSRVDYQQYAPANYGKQKVPSLRNVDKRPAPDFVKAYAHNGYFKSLKGIVHFYNTRDAKPRCPDKFTTEAGALAMDCWPEPEVANNVNTKELGNLHLTDKQEDAIVAFLKTLSDGYVLP
jgi:cytochrome c peroxidase